MVAWARLALLLGVLLLAPVTFAQVITAANASKILLRQEVSLGYDAIVNARAGRELLGCLHSAAAAPRWSPSAAVLLHGAASQPITDIEAL